MNNLCSLQLKQIFYKKQTQNGLPENLLKKIINTKKIILPGYPDENF